MQVDLAPLALELACRGHQDPDGLSWLDRPPAAAFDQARDLLAHLGALDHQGAITQHGRRMVGMGCHPRLAHMILKAKEIGLGSLACDITALLNERDLFRSSDTPPDADLRLRLEVLRSREKGRFYGLEVDEKTLRRVNREARHWRKRVGITSSEDDIEACGFVLAFAYPDRIAQQRPGQAGRYKLSNGRAAAFMHPQPLSDVSYIVVALLDGQQTESNIFLAAPIDLELIKQHFADQITENTSISWDPVLQVVNVRLQSMLGALVLKEAPHKHPDPGTVAQVLLDGITQAGLDVLPWTREARNLQARLVFLRRLDPEWPDLSDSALFAGLSDWLMPHIVGKSSLSEVRKIDLAAILRGKLTWRQNADVDMLAPTHWLVPSGSRIRIDYDNPESPVLAVRLQEMFGLTETPRIAGGKVPLTLHLLSPAHRPVQVTQDLKSFWQHGYFDVKKDLRGRYPKHYWPDDPLLATPTQRIKPKKKNK